MSAISTPAVTCPILVVDDYPTTIRIVRTLLRRLGFTNIDDACGGREALAKMRDTDYALVISDFSMKPMSGMELLNQARAEEKLRGTPFLMLANDSGEREEAERRALASILKPFSSTALRDSLTPVFGTI